MAERATGVVVVVQLFSSPLGKSPGTWGHTMVGQSHIVVNNGCLKKWLMVNGSLVVAMAAKVFSWL